MKIKSREIDEGVLQFNEVTKELIQLLSSLTEMELNEVPFAGSWTAGQLGEHLLKSYNIADVLNGNTSITTRNSEEKLAGIRELFLNFEIKMESPDFIVPTQNPIRKSVLIESIRNQVRTIFNLITQPDFNLNLTCLDFEFPGTGTLTRREWIGFLNVHTMRRVHQLKNIIKVLKKKI